MEDKAMSEPADVLEAAADALLVRGRSRSFTAAPDGSLCVRGALGYVTTGNPYDGWFYSGAVGALWAAVGNIPDWNRAADDFEVIDTLRHVAKDLRNEASA